MLLTFGEFKQGPAVRSSGLCPTSRDFMRYTNDAVRQLLRRGRWWGTIQPMRGCVYSNCVTWPRSVAAVLAIKNGGNRRSEVFNRWFQFLPWDSGLSGEACRWKRDGGRTAVFDSTSPVFNPILCGASMFLRVFIDSPADVGKTITFFGIDSNGQTAGMNMPDGTWREGVVLTLANPVVESPIQFRSVSMVLKDATSSTVRVYQWDGSSVNPDSSPLMLDMARYEPSEKSPDYLVSKVAALCDGTVTALVKLGFVPITCDSDLVVIDNEDALACQIQSIRYRESGDSARTAQYEGEAFRELNYQMKERFPDEQFVVDFRPFGADTLARQRIGRLL